jgi:hypothetical protein
MFGSTIHHTELHFAQSAEESLALVVADLNQFAVFLFGELMSP